MRFTILLLFFIHTALAQNLILTNVSVLPMTTNTTIANTTVFIKNGLIEKINTGSKDVLPKNYKVIDCKGKFLMPGLSDMHTHFPDAESPIKLQEFLKLNLASGVTTLRSMRGEEYQLALRDSINKGQKKAPAIYVSYVFPTKDSLFTKDSIEKYVNIAKTKKYDFIKYLGGLTETNLKYLKETGKQLVMILKKWKR